MTTVMICEKPDAAKKIAYAIADGKVKHVNSKDGVVYFSVKNNLYAMDTQTFEPDTIKLEEKTPIFGYELFAIFICIVSIIAAILLTINKKKKSYKEK